MRKYRVVVAFEVTDQDGVQAPRLIFTMQAKSIVAAIDAASVRAARKKALDGANRARKQGIALIADYQARLLGRQEARAAISGDIKNVQVESSLIKRGETAKLWLADTVGGYADLEAWLRAIHRYLDPGGGGRVK